ncbi:MAG TPA: RnfABCDGE type electron transport complex subunit G [bacterium]|nr:RnfABCDGE type electron transport complex subunit G [bacterium]HPN35370.1 RnfABCDGE type electron transport complex subunit G [bacterium]
MSAEPIHATGQPKPQVSPRIIAPIFIIALFSGLALALVNSATAERIRLVKEKELNDALALVMPGFDNQPAMEKIEKDQGKQGRLIFYPAKKGDQLMGYAVESTVFTGYSGEVAVIYGVSADGVVGRVKLLRHNETPGLGSKAGLPGFLNQFEKSSLASFRYQVKKDGGQVDAVTGATISSRAVALAVERGLQDLKLVVGN